MVAVTSDQAGVDMMRLLIEHGADVNADKKKPTKKSPTKKTQTTPSWRSPVQQGTWDKVKLLIEAGAERWATSARAATTFSSMPCTAGQ
jgi:ankyrin repeat protein